MQDWSNNKADAITAAVSSISEMSDVMSGSKQLNDWNPITNNTTFTMTIKPGTNCTLYLLENGNDMGPGSIVDTPTDIQTNMYSAKAIYVRCVPNSGYSNPVECCKVIFNNEAVGEYYPWKTRDMEEPQSIESERF